LYATAYAEGVRVRLGEHNVSGLLREYDVNLDASRRLGMA